MKSQVLDYFVVISLLLLINIFTGCEEMKGNSQVQSQVDSIATKLSKYEIGKTEILHIPPRILTRTTITPDMLERSFYYKLIIHDASGSIHREKLIKLLKSLKVQQHSEMADIRWGIIFYDLDDRRAGAIYFDRWGRHGAVGDTPVSFRGDLFKWLDGNFSCCFR